MAELKEILKQGIRFGAIRMVHPKQIDGVADRLLQVDLITHEYLEEAGKEIAGGTE